MIYFIIIKLKNDVLFPKDLDQNLALITSYRTWINDDGEIIEQHLHEQII